MERASSVRVVVVLSALALLFTGTATAHAESVLTADIDRRAVLLDGGEAVRVSVEVDCPSGADVLEAFVYVTTPDGGTSDFVGIPVVCDGTDRTHQVRVTALDTPFTTGKARASGYVLLSSDQSVSPTSVIKIKKR